MPGIDPGGPLSGARWVVRSTTDRLVRVAQGFLQAEGFEERPDDSAERFAAVSEGWVTAVLSVGAEKPARRRWWALRSSDVTTAQAGPHPQTVVVAASRPVASGVAELVVFPYVSGDADASHVGAVAPRIASALARITEAAGSESAMLSHESLSEPPSDGFPASREAVRHALGWAGPTR